MVNWEQAFKLEDKGKRWDGEEGFIVFRDIIWARGLRLVMITNEEYIGIREIAVYR